MDLDGFCKVLAANRGEAEDSARMTPEVRRAATEAGIWLLVAPREVGGGELSLPELAGGLRAPRRGRPGVRLDRHELHGHRVPGRVPGTRRSPKKCWPAPTARSVTPDSPTDMDATRVDGGWQIDARFRFMTGAADARWCTRSRSGP